MARCACTTWSAALSARAILSDFTPIMGIGLPSILANLATPVSAVYVTRVWSDFGEAAVAGGAIVDRVVPLAFGVIFALTGSVGPIIGQNYGAKLMGRVRRAIADAFLLSTGYALCAWAALAARRALDRAPVRRAGRRARIS